MHPHAKRRGWLCTSLPPPPNQWTVKADSTNVFANDQIGKFRRFAIDNDQTPSGACSLNPSGERKSGMPYSVEIPAPVNGAIRRTSIGGQLGR
jgi:hypothetical protein